MRILRIFNELVALILVACFSQLWVPLPALGQSYAEIVHRNDCTTKLKMQTDALNRQQWPLLVSSARQYLGDCRDLFTGNGEEASSLGMIGIGLNEQGKFDDATHVLERCVTVKPDAAYCFADLGKAFEGLGKIEEARAAYVRAISIGGYDNVNAGAIGFARRQLARLPPEVKLPQPERVGDSEPRAASDARKFGTGFFVSTDGHILTNNHVVEGCTSVATADGVILSVVSRNEAADLALLTSNVAPVSVAVFGNSRSLHIGDAVMAFGFPLPGLLTPEGNSTTGIISALSGPKGDLNLVQITAPVQPGDSGGPLVDQQGRVVGVVVSKLDALRVARITGDIPQNVNFAIRGNLVAAFLDSVAVPYRTRGPAIAMGWAGVARATKSMSVSIVCTQ